MGRVAGNEDEDGEGLNYYSFVCIRIKTNIFDLNKLNCFNQLNSFFFNVDSVYISS